ncbi:hypothetical protein XAB3213_1030002 [Xanthomonas citri pv. bilvae]|nr:hypothetical protein XAB3213_1030002 [Xanthomonas citri pv. bilvae]
MSPVLNPACAIGRNGSSYSKTARRSISLATLAEHEPTTQLTWPSYRKRGRRTTLAAHTRGNTWHVF